MIRELVVHGILFGLMLFLYITTFSFQTVNIGGKLGPGWWPRFVLTLGMIFTLVSVWSAVKKGRKNSKAFEKTKLHRHEMISLAISAGICLAALLLVGIIGYLGAIPIVVLGFMLQLGAKKPLSIALVTILSTLFFIVIFGRVMQVSLPRGMGIFRSISFFLY